MTFPAVLLSGRRWAGLLALVAGGCGDAGVADCAGSPDTAVGDRGEMPLPVEGVLVRLVIPDAVAPGEMVPMTIRLTNTTSDARALYLRGREVTLDVAITDSAGNEVWRLLPGDPIPAIVQLRTLAAGDTIELRHEWNQVTRQGGRLPDGTYTVRAEVLTDGSASLISDGERLVIRSSESGGPRPRR